MSQREGTAARGARVVARLGEVGPRRAARVAARRASRRARGLARDARLRRRPLTASPAEVAGALGGAGLEVALRERARPALPTVARFEASLAELGGRDRDELLDRADAIVAHRFDLLGSGPVDLGPVIDWSRDFKSGRAWPQRHISLLRAFHFDDSDVKVPWELSRFQHLPLLAAAHRVTGKRAYIDEMGAQLEAWIESNPVEMGVNWLCTMDVAIRAVNWIAALTLVAAEATRATWSPAVAESLLLHGRFIHTHLEDADGRRTNHYLSDVVGLLVVAALFSGGREGAQWARWASAELVGEMGHQVRADGCGDEASIPYHRLVCELFLCGTQAADAVGADIPDEHRERLDRMLAFAADYTRPDGLAPQVGDNDDGRLLPLDDYGRGDFRSHRHLFRQAGHGDRPASASAAYPDGGYYAMRASGLYVLVRCGDTGMKGVGGHAHNDQLAIELCWEGQPMIVDPGTYDYYTDERMRQLLRSTRSHATLQIDGAEQNDLPAWPRFPLGDRSRAEALEWSVGDDAIVFAGRHRGFEALPAPAVHERRVELRPRERALAIRDVVASDAPHLLEWAFPLAGGEASASGSRATVDLGDRRLTLEAEDVELRVEPGWYSPAYGVRERIPVLRGRRTSRPGMDVTELRFAVECRGERAAAAGSAVNAAPAAGGDASPPASAGG